MQQPPFSGICYGLDGRKVQLLGIYHVSMVCIHLFSVHRFLLFSSTRLVKFVICVIGRVFQY